MLLLIGLENLGICTDLRADRGGQHGPALVLLRVGQPRDLDHKALARFRWGGVGLRRTAPPRSPPLAGGGPDMRVDRVIPPGLGPAAAPARPAVLVRRDRGGGLCLTSQPPRLDRGPMGCHGGGLRWRSGIRLVCCCASGLECTTTKRSASETTRPSRYSRMVEING